MAKYPTGPGGWSITAPDKRGSGKGTPARSSAAFKSSGSYPTNPYNKSPLGMGVPRPAARPLPFAPAPTPFKPAWTIPMLDSPEGGQLGWAARDRARAAASPMANARYQMWYASQSAARSAMAGLKASGRFVPWVAAGMYAAELASGWMRVREEEAAMDIPAHYPGWNLHEDCGPAVDDIAAPNEGVPTSLIQTFCATRNQVSPGHVYGVNSFVWNNSQNWFTIQQRVTNSPFGNWRWRRRRWYQRPGGGPHPTPVFVPASQQPGRRPAFSPWPDKAPVPKSRERPAPAPAIDPMSQRPGSPQPLPVPLSQHLIYLRRPNPMRHEQTEVGPKPDPISDPKPRPEDPGEPGGPPPFIPSSKPGRGVRERKVIVQAGGHVLRLVRKGVGAATEGLDIIKCLWSALPQRHRRHRRGTPFGRQMLEDLWKHWRDVDMSAFAKCALENEIEDRIIGAIGQEAGRVSRRLGLHGSTGLGLQVGGWRRQEILQEARKRVPRETESGKPWGARSQYPVRYRREDWHGLPSS